MMSINVKAIAAELIATAVFVWCGCGSTVAVLTFGGSDLDGGMVVAIALGFGLAFSSLVYSIGHISGGHMNPAITFAFALLQKLDLMHAGLYILAQMLGALIGSLLLWGSVSGLTHQCEHSTFPSAIPVCVSSDTGDGDDWGPPFGLAYNRVSDEITLGNAFIIEAVGTFLLIHVVLNSAVDSKSGAHNAAPISIGWAVLLAHLVLVPFTRCGINPARSFGPFLANSFGGFNTWVRGWWVFFVAPFAGSAFAALFYQFILKSDEEVEQEEPAKEGFPEEGEAEVGVEEKVE